jgi:opacity protein-like surface antigen
MRSRAALVLSLAVLTAAPVTASAQDYGDGFGIGGVLLPSGSTLILGKTRLGPEFALEVELAFSSMSNDDTSSTDLGVGVGALKHWNQGNEVQPYFGARVGIGHSSADYGESSGGETDETNFYVGAALGAEYFVTKRLSLEGEAGVRLIFGSLGIATGTRLAALLYL